VARKIGGKFRATLAAHNLPCLPYTIYDPCPGPPCMSVSADTCLGSTSCNFACCLMLQKRWKQAKYFSVMVLSHCTLHSCNKRL